MKEAKSFRFERARRITPAEVKGYRKAIEAKLGKKRGRRRGRPPKAASAKYLPVAIRLHPLVVAWAKREAKKRGVGYQTVINEVLLANVAAWISAQWWPRVMAAANNPGIRAFMGREPWDEPFTAA